MNPRVKAVRVKENFVLLVTFANGEEKLFDVKPFLETGIFKTLKNLAMFATARAEYGTVVWQNEVDLDPDTLYLDSVDSVST